MSETDLAPFRLPEKELLRESGLAWAGRGWRVGRVALALPRKLMNAARLCPPESR